MKKFILKTIEFFLLELHMLVLLTITNDVKITTY